MAKNCQKSEKFQTILYITLLDIVCRHCLKTKAMVTNESTRLTLIKDSIWSLSQKWPKTTENCQKSEKFQNSLHNFARHCM